jgi:hypothetical protein
MKVDGLDWMDWLHKVRRESEDERKRLGLSGEEWLRQGRARAEAIMAALARERPPVARDRNADDKSLTAEQPVAHRNRRRGKSR